MTEFRATFDRHPDYQLVYTVDTNPVSGGHQIWWSLDIVKNGAPSWDFGGFEWAVRIGKDIIGRRASGYDFRSQDRIRLGGDNYVHFHKAAETLECAGEVPTDGSSITLGHARAAGQIHLPAVPKTAPPPPPPKKHHSHPKRTAPDNANHKPTPPRFINAPRVKIDKVTDRTISLSWTPGSYRGVHPTTYMVVVATNAELKNPIFHNVTGATHMTVPAVKPGKYYVAVKQNTSEKMGSSWSKPIPVQVTAKPPPPPPKLIWADPAVIERVTSTATTVTVTFHSGDGHGLPILKHRIILGIDKLHSYQARDVPESATSVTFEGLNPATTYYVWTRTINKNGLGHPSDVAQVATLAAAWEATRTHYYPQTLVASTHGSRVPVDVWVGNEGEYQ